MVAARFIWVYPATFLPRVLFPKIREREPDTDWTAPLIVGWAGMRGVVSLAIAFSIPLTLHDGGPFPGRNLVLFLTFTTVIGTLVVQGLTLPPLIRLLKLPGRDPQAETLAEAQAQSEASAGSRARLDELLADERNALPPPLADRLRTVLERRRNAVWERLGTVNEVTGESADDTYRRLSREMIGPSARCSWTAGPAAASTTRCCGRCCAGWTWRRRRRTGRRVRTEPARGVRRASADRAVPVTTAATGRARPGKRPPRPEP